MGELAIRVDRLSKEYRRGKQTLDAFPNIRETLSRSLARLFRSTGQETHRSFWALRDVSFDVSRGEVVGVVGSNGAGKSTLLKIMSRIVEPSAGRVSVHGRLGCLLEVGTGFHPDLTGRENVFLNGAILGMSRMETGSKFDAIVDFSGIGEFIDTPVKRYSSGMYLRLGFAVAAHIDPDILIIDEVLAVGDAAFQAKCIRKVGELVREGRTVFIVSHQLPIVQKLCSRALLLQNGSLVLDGSPEQVIRHYLKGLDHSTTIVAQDEPDRPRENLPWIERIRVLGPSDGALLCGAPARFVFEVQGNASAMSCLFTIFDEQGASVSSFDSPTTDRANMQNARIFCCQIEVLPLRPGFYRIEAALRSSIGVLQDELGSRHGFEVLSGLFHGREPRGAGQAGPVEIDHRWI